MNCAIRWGLSLRPVDHGTPVAAAFRLRSQSRDLKVWVSRPIIDPVGAAFRLRQTGSHSSRLWTVDPLNGYCCQFDTVPFLPGLFRMYRMCFTSSSSLRRRWS